MIIISFFTLNLERLSKELTIKLFKADVIIEGVLDAREVRMT